MCGSRLQSGLLDSVRVLRIATEMQPARSLHATLLFNYSNHVIFPMVPANILLAILAPVSKIQQERELATKKLQASLFTRESHSIANFTNGDQTPTCLGLNAAVAMPVFMLLFIFYVMAGR